MEWVQGAPNRVYQTLHYRFDKPDNTASVSPVKDVTEWHLYAVERTDEAVTFFINGEETMRYSNEGIAQKYPFNQWDYDIILNFSLGGMLNGNLTWAGAIFDEDLPGEMWVDWVRVTEIAN
jgi:licheninase